METQQPTIMCPMCASTSLSANKKGYNGKRASIGMALMGTQGLTWGIHKGMNDIEITCLGCGNTFKPGEGARSMNELEKRKQDILDRKSSEKNYRIIKSTIGIVLIIIICIWIYNLLK